MILDLLKDKQITSRDIVLDEKSDYDWTEKVAKNFCKQITDHQRSILKTLINGNGEATIKELEHGIKEADLSWTSNKTIGGALAGLTRKCQSQSIPLVWFYRDEKYCINREAETYIRKYIDLN